MIYNNDIQYNTKRKNRTRMFMNHPHDFSKTSMIQSLYLVRSPHLLLGIPTFCYAIPGHFNTKNCEIDATEAYETR